ncbi:hypothetical protein MXD81_08945, partial [Microbacteriaceae bacterium K1510]|nr:hypothetical protein [Microbacteriaceae bacterium K1510]
AKPVLIWETKQKPDERVDDNLLQMRRPAREEGRTGEATAMEWTIGTDEANGKEEASAAITMVSSGFGEAVQAPTAVQTSSSTPKMLAA